MPVIDSDYRCGPLFRNGHIQTIYPTLVRQRPDIRPETITLDTPDGDQLELFLNSRDGARSLVIITHGLESHGKEAGLLSFAQKLHARGYDTLTWSMRSCSKNVNRTPWFYIGCDYQDLKQVIDTQSQGYSEVILVGFSLGGTITANYLGREATGSNPKIKGCFLLSTPLELHSFHESMRSRLNHFLYQRQVVDSLLSKFVKKLEFVDFGEQVDPDKVRNAKTVDEIEEFLFAPLHGYQSATHYRDSASAVPYLGQSPVPLYILSAEDDPFLDERSLPYDTARRHDHIYLEVARHGGHMGFVKKKQAPYHWYEQRFFWFANNVLAKPDASFGGQRQL